MKSNPQGHRAPKSRIDSNPKPEWVHHSSRRLDSSQKQATIPENPTTQLLGDMDEEIASEPWCTFGEFDSQLAAEVIRSLLQAEEVDCSIDSARLELGIPAKFILSVPRSKLHRARWIIEQSDLTERELEFLATGTWTHED